MCMKKAGVVIIDDGFLHEHCGSYGREGSLESRYSR